MFLGHYAVALAAKRSAPTASLGTLTTAAALLDLIWPVLVIAGIERVSVAPGNTAFTPLEFESYPISHSLLMSVVWGVLLAGGYYAFRRSVRNATVVAALVVSHWFLDVIVHRPDLPIAPGARVSVGLGLWNSVAGTLCVELLLFALGLAVYARTTTALDRAGRWGLAGFTAFLLVIFSGAAFGPPAPTAKAVAWSDMGQWLLILWAAYVDAHRVARR
jgi:hypothetical protein